MVNDLMRRLELPMAPDTPVETYMEVLQQGRTALHDVSLQLEECKNQFECESCQNQDIEARLDDLAERARLLEDNLRVQTVKFEEFQQSRHRFLDHCARKQQGDVVADPAMQNRLAEPDVPVTEISDCYADAMLYTQKRRSDEDTFEKLYAFPVNDILDMAFNYKPGIKLINTYVMIQRQNNQSETFSHLIAFAFLRFSYRVKFWLNRSPFERALFREEVDSSVARFWKVYEDHYMVD